MEFIKKMKVVRVDRNEFELEDGRVFEHIEPMDYDISIEEFQAIYDEAFKTILSSMEDTTNG